MDKLTHLLRTIIKHPTLHARWLNTLSFLENCGAKKIAKYEHHTLVREEMLKHAAEEFRHAHDLKRQIFRITPNPPATYALETLLGGFSTLHYLNKLEIEVSRLSKTAAYPLVTYAIEMRAKKLYPIYQLLLKEMGCKVSVRSILLEEEEHLHEMVLHLQSIDAISLSKYACKIEERIYTQWITSIESQIEFIR